MTPGWISRLLLLAAAMIAANLAAAVPAAAQQVVAIVSGQPITAYDIDQRSKFVQLSLKKTPTRKEVLDTLIEEKIKTIEAQRFGMEIGKPEVDRAVGAMASRAGMTPEQFAKELAGRGVDLETIRSRMRADTAWNQLVRGRFPATFTIGDKEVRDAAQSAGGEGDDVSYDYRLRQILFIVPSGSPQSLIEGRKREAENFRGRFENCDDGIKLARTLRDVAVRDPVRRSSNDLTDSMRAVLNSTAVGKLTKPEVTGQGVAVFALCEKRENTTDTPKKQKIKQDLFNKRFEERSKTYLNELKRQYMIEIK